MPQSLFGNAPTIADLITACGAVGKPEANMMSASAAADGITIGEAMHTAGLLQPSILRAAVLCHIAIQKKMLTYELALQVMNVVKGSEVPLEEAYKRIGYNENYFAVTAEISDLLLQSGAIDEELSEAAYYLCVPNWSGFLTLLVQHEFITDLVGEYLLTLHARIQKNELSKADAVKLLSAKITAPAAVPDFESETHIRLGELLLASDLITAVQLISAVERGRLYKKQFGMYLVEDGVITDRILHSALALQKKVTNKQMTPFDAVSALIAETQASLSV